MEKRGFRDKLPFILYWLIRITILFAIIAAVINKRWVILFISSLTFILTFLPLFLESKFKIDLNIELEIVIVLFIYAGLFLGEVHGYYTRFWWWDIFLHTISGIALGFFGFLVMFTLYYQGKVKSSNFLMAMFAFGFAVSIGVIWEIFEFFMDSSFGFNMQKSGLVDTMWDLIVDSLGALFSSVVGYFYVRNKKGFILDRIIKRFMILNPKIFKKKIFKKND